MQVSTAELKGEWDVEVLPLNKRFVLKAGEDAYSPQCNSWCKARTASLDKESGASMSTVTVETVHLAGESEVGLYTISMARDALYGSLRLDSEGKPHQAEDESEPNFWLEGLMTIKMRFAGSDEVISLVSRQPVLQVGRASSWPPHNTKMHDVSGPNEYVRQDDPESGPVVLLWSGSITITDKVSAFLAADNHITSYSYVQDALDAPVTGVRFSWEDHRADVPLIDHYNVFRRPFETHDAGKWERIATGVQDDSFTDHEFDGSIPMTYKVRQIFVDPFGDEVQGCGTETDYTVPALPSNQAQLVATGFLDSV